MDRDRELHEMADEGRALMSDYIKRTDALDIVADNNVTGEITLNRYDKIIDGIYEIPSAYVAPVRRGQWKPFDRTWGRSVLTCTACGDAIDVPTEMGKPLFVYCPNCGASMYEGDKNETD